LATAFVAWVFRANHPRVGLLDDEPVAPNLTAILACGWQWLVLASQIFLFPVGLLNRNRPLVRGRRPIILVHGYGVNSAVWWYIKKHLRRDGQPNLVTVNLPTVKAGVPVCVQILAATVERVCAEAAVEQVDLVGHSLGGLVAASYLAGLGGAGSDPQARVHALVTIGSPFKGTVLAFLGMGPAARQMRPESSYLKDFAEAWAAANRRAEAPTVTTTPAERSTSLISSFDNLVIPFESALLPGARSEEFSYLGHDAMLVSHQVYAAVVQGLAAPDQKEAPLAKTA